MRFLFAAGAHHRAMHIARFSATGEMLWLSLCGRRDFNRSINAPWKLGKRICRHCVRAAGGETTSE